MFLTRMFLVFFLETEPTSSRAKPACIQKTRTPPKRSQKVSMSPVLMSLRWPTSALRASICSWRAATVAAKSAGSMARGSASVKGSYV